MPIKRALRWLGFIKDTRPIGIYSIKMLSLAAELEHEELIPTELRYVFKREPRLKKEVWTLLEKNPHLSIGVRTTERTPEHVVKAIIHVSYYSQHLTITTWLPLLIKEGKKPIITAADRLAARKDKIDLDKEVELIISHRDEYKRVILLNTKNKEPSAKERLLIDRMNKVLEPVTFEAATHAMIFDSAHTRTEIAQAIIKSLLVIGPITHVIEHFAHGWGKVFAASIDDIMSEVAEFFALRGAGFSWKSIWKRSFILLPVLILATWGILSTEYFIRQGQFFIAGLLFGVGAVALSLTTAVQSIFMFHGRVKELEQEKKMTFKKRSSLWWCAVVQDFTNPARMGLFIGAMASPILSGVIFNFFSAWVYNGWVLALLGSAETIVAGITVIYSRRINEYRFKRKLDKMIKY